MDSVIVWIQDNKEWIFSGIGVTAVLALWKLFTLSFKVNKNNKSSNKACAFGLRSAARINTVDEDKKDNEAKAGGIDVESEINVRK